MKPIFTSGTWLALASLAHAATSATIVPDSLVQGDVRSTMQGNSYANETNAMNDWSLDTGGFGGTVYPVSFTNPNYNGNSWGGTPNTMVTFGNGGTVTLKLDSTVAGTGGDSMLGLFTAQAINAGNGGFLNGHMEASILLSSDGVNWKTLGGLTVAADYTGVSRSLNSPTVGYDFGTLDTAWTYGSPGTSQSNLDALPVADYLTPMPDDSLFNGAGTNADRLAMKGNSSPGDYAAIFGDSGGGNWFGLSDSGLASIDYVRLNGVNGTSAMGVRLDSVFVVPEPSAFLLAALSGLFSLRRKR